MSRPIYAKAQRRKVRKEDNTYWMTETKGLREFQEKTGCLTQSTVKKSSRISTIIRKKDIHSSSRNVFRKKYGHKPAC